MTLNRLAWNEVKLGQVLLFTMLLFYAPNVTVINLWYLFMGCRVTSPSPPPSPCYRQQRCYKPVTHCLNAQSFFPGVTYPLFYFPRYLQSRFIYAHFHFITSIYSVHKKDHIIFNTRIWTGLYRAICAMYLWR